MFEDIRREVEKLKGITQFSFSVPLDGKGFYDRRCPNPECGGDFKVLYDDWGHKVPSHAFCPFCRHEAPSDQWNTPQQDKHFESAAQAEFSRLANGAISRGIARSKPVRMGGGLFSVSMSLSYTPGRVPEVVPAAATHELRQEFTCEACGCRYASLGASFFCPACGHNSATTCFQTTLETVRKTLNALVPLHATLEQQVDADTAKNAVRQLLEDQFARLVGAFERFNEALFEKVPTAQQLVKKGSIFQRVDDASALWQQATGIGYGDFLTPAGLQQMKLLFQRRHVLSHRQGIVDQPYLDRSGDTSYSVGQRLIVRDADVLGLVELLEKVGAGLLAVVVATGTPAPAPASK